jgi:hypothetical protein
MVTQDSGEFMGSGRRIRWGVLIPAGDATVGILDQSEQPLTPDVQDIHQVPHGLARDGGPGQVGPAQCAQARMTSA